MPALRRVTDSGWKVRVTEFNLPVERRAGQSHESAGDSESLCSPGLGAESNSGSDSDAFSHVYSGCRDRDCGAWRLRPGDPGLPG